MVPCAYNFVFEQIPEDVKERCLRYPWFAALIRDNSLKSILTPGRQPDQYRRYTFISRTLNSQNTISACQSWYKQPSSASTIDDPLNLGELQVFCCLSDGVEGHNGICHGGFLSALIDHFMGLLAHLYPGGASTFTRYIHVDFRKQCPVPGAILCRVWISKIEGRKLWIKGRIEDEQADAYVTAEGLCLHGKANL